MFISTLFNFPVFIMHFVTLFITWCPFFAFNLYHNNLLTISRFLEISLQVALNHIALSIYVFLSKNSSKWLMTNCRLILILFLEFIQIFLEFKFIGFTYRCLESNGYSTVRHKERSSQYLLTIFIFFFHNQWNIVPLTKDNISS